MARPSAALFNILLVEDNEDDVALTRRALSKAHIVNPFVHVRDGVEALNYLDERACYANVAANALPIVVLLDVNLPRLDGIGLLTAIRTDDELRPLPVAILLSADTDRMRFPSALSSTCSYLTKPLDFDQLARMASERGLVWTAQPPSLASGSDAGIPLARRIPLALCPRR